MKTVNKPFLVALIVLAVASAPLWMSGIIASTWEDTPVEDLNPMIQSRRDVFRSAMKFEAVKLGREKQIPVDLDYILFMVGLEMDSEVASVTFNMNGRKTAFIYIFTQGEWKMWGKELQ